MADQEGSVFDAVAAAPVVARFNLNLRSRPQRVTRDKKTGRVKRVRKAHGGHTVRLRAPWRPGGAAEPRTLNIVEAKEVNAAPGDDPIHWVLLTGWPCRTEQEAIRMGGPTGTSCAASRGWADSSGARAMASRAGSRSGKDGSSCAPWSRASDWPGEKDVANDKGVALGCYFETLNSLLTSPPAPTLPRSARGGRRNSSTGRRRPRAFSAGVAHRQWPLRRRPSCLPAK